MQQHSMIISHVKTYPGTLLIGAPEKIGS